ncbi:MAG: AsmA family protein [Phycisphaeraceae bacterium]
MKLLLKIVVAAFILVVLVIAGLVLYIDHIALRGVEHSASSALGVNTTLRSIHLGLLSGGASMDEMKVSNPQGFKTNHFLKFDTSEVKVSLGSLTSDLVEIPSLIISDIDINLEKDAKGQANYKVILDSMKKTDDGQKPAAKEGKKYVIRQVVFKNVSVHADVVQIGGLFKPVTVTVPEIRLQNVGSGGDNAKAMSEVTSIFVHAILDQAIKAGMGILPADITADVTAQMAKLEPLKNLGVGTIETLGKIGQSGLDLEKQAQNFQELGKKATESSDQVGKTLEELGGGLLGGDKKKPEQNK